MPRPYERKVHLFTFQYGEIKSPADKLPYRKGHKFTFQYGEIKSHSTYLTVPQDWLFTFQYGEIKRFDYSAASAPLCNLHSSMERLKDVMVKVIK